MDPSFVTPSPLSQQSIDSPSNTLTTGPDVACLTLASNFGDSPQPLTKGAGGTKKQYCQTQKEMAAYRAKQAQLKKAKALAKAKGKRSKACGGGSQSSRCGGESAPGPKLWPVCLGACGMRAADAESMRSCKKNKCGDLSGSLSGADQALGGQFLSFNS
ncbi:hypothetical protein PGT21_034209 [Puccinia graminis f. sp. tritici]|uniref:Uncharacterized protein n=1 Tax=Puccinia graminis f. sp. tritici TaxID=56615 RepID=A0A5B0M894_PUCGR|nr:hypothetical protein PGT21_034209 [Puccinia graminis f. sp. tritici]KAA1120321.1 hypothetical protein PGTUg99_013224 [Puccinia graminis f. sp. tritici]